MHAGDLHARHTAHVHQAPLRQQLPRHADIHDGRRRLAAQGQRMPGDQRGQFIQTKMQPADLKDHRQLQCPDGRGFHRRGFCGGPIAAACLLTDVALGLINRFASQLNVYVLAMPIKCGIAAFLLCFYFGLLLSHAPELFDFTRESILKLNNLLPGGN